MKKIFTIIAAGSAGGSSSSSSQQALQNSGQPMTDEQIAIMGAILVAALVFLVIWTIIKIFLLNPVEVGCHNFFKNNLTDNSVNLSEIKAAFGPNYKRSVGTIFLRDLFILLWMLLLIFPAIIKSYSYAMVPYILIDEPELSATEVITRSREMMNGNKWRAFVLDLSFIGWILLTLVTCGIVGIFWTNPYMYSTRAALYQQLKNGSSAQ